MFVILKYLYKTNVSLLEGSLHHFNLANYLFYSRVYIEDPTLFYN